MPTTSRYAPALRYLHWIMAALIVIAYIAIEQRGAFGRGTGRTIMLQTHFWIGISIFALLWWRLAVRIRRGAPPITPAPPAWQAIPAKLLHLSLYAFFMVMPILGLMTAWTDGKVLYLPFTDIALPALMAENEELARQLEDLHGSIGEAFYWVIGLHVVAALYHHFFREDDTLRRMS
ncbi:MAG: cytochrome b [Xanthomonadales bacterium]|nr:cytochrome b [Xanthomonadales bacterium]